eukprot:3886418-Rhodomonas_salina.2
MGLCSAGWRHRADWRGAGSTGIWSELCEGRRGVPRLAACNSKSDESSHVVRARDSKTDSLRSTSYVS